MTKLEMALKSMKHPSGVPISVSKVKRFSLHFTEDKNSFELIAWEAVASPRTYRIKLDIKYVDELLNDIREYHIKGEEEIIDIFNEKKGVTQW